MMPEELEKRFPDSWVTIGELKTAMREIEAANVALYQSVNITGQNMDIIVKAIESMDNRLKVIERIVLGDPNA